MCVVYSDEVDIFCKDYRQRFKDIDVVLALLRLAAVSENLPKRHFLRNKTEYLGLIPMLGRLAAASKNVDEI